MGPVEGHAACVIAVRPRVREHVDVHRGHRAVFRRADRDGDPLRMVERRPGQLLLAGTLARHWSSGGEHRERDEVLGEQLLPAAEAAAEATGQDP